MILINKFILYFRPDKRLAPVILFGCLPALTGQLAASEAGRSNSFEIRASLSSSELQYRKINEASGIATASFTDDEGHDLLWVHEEDKKRLGLLSTSGDQLYLGDVHLGKWAPLDAEDIAVVESAGGGTLYLADTGNNNKNQQLCLRVERQGQSLCRLAEGRVQFGNNNIARDNNRQQCLEMGGDRLWLDQGMDFNRKPAVLRMVEPNSPKQALRQPITGLTRITFQYPSMCGQRRCGEYDVMGLEPLNGQYNVEAMFALREPDSSHSIYLVAKAHKLLEKFFANQQSDQASCHFDSDGRADVFRLINMQEASESGVYVAEYVTSIEAARLRGHKAQDPIRITAADYLPLHKNRGVLVMRTKTMVYKWPVTNLDQNRLDIASALQRRPYLGSGSNFAYRRVENESGVQAEERLEGIALSRNGDIYHFGECKGLDECRLYVSHDEFDYLSGDVNLDGERNQNDLVLLDGLLDGSEGALFCDAAADLNVDGKLNSDDLRLMHKFLETGVWPKNQARTGLGCQFYSLLNAQ